MRGFSLLLMTASAAAIALAYGPLMADFVENLWAKSHYQHFPFVLLAAALLFVQRLGVHSTGGGPGPTGYLPYTAYGIAWLLLGLAHYLPSPLLTAISLVVLLGGWGLAFARRAGVDFPLGPWLLLWLVIPPPLRLDYRLMSFLQHTSSQLSSYTLDLLGINHLMDGNALVLQEKQLFVDEACSGIISVVSIVSCAAMYGVWRRRSTTQTLLTMILAAGWAALLNVVRIVSIALAWVRLGLDWSEGVSHTTLGLAVFAASLVLLVASDWLLKALLSEIGPRWEQITSEPVGFGAWLVSWWDRIQTSVDRSPASTAGRSSVWMNGLATASLGLAPTIAFASLGAGQFLLTGAVTEVGSKVSAEAFAEALQQRAMPEAVGELRYVGCEYESRTATSQFGQHSVVFEYADPNALRYLVSCDFFFDGGWHELATCYTGIGWRVDAREVMATTGDVETQPFEFAQMELTKPDGRLAVVTYMASTVDGDALRPPRFNLSDRLRDAFARRGTAARRQDSFQAQVMVEQATGITDATRRNSRSLLDAAKKHFVRAVTETPRLPR